MYRQASGTNPSIKALRQSRHQICMSLEGMAAKVLTYARTKSSVATRIYRVAKFLSFLDPNI